MTADTVVFAALVAIVPVFMVRAVAHFRTAWSDPKDAAPLVRSIRALVLAACAVLLAAATAKQSTALMWLGLIILAEEIYETGAVLLILRSERRSELRG